MARPSTLKPLVAVLLGGPSSEHEVSLATGALVLARIDRKRFEPAPVFIGRDRVWHFATLPHPLHRSWREALPSSMHWRPDDGTAPPWRPEVCFIGLHGTYGEDGQVQTLLDHLGIPFTGSGAEASRLAMNKLLAKGIYRARGLPVAREVELTASEGPDAAATRVVQALQGPWVVKPRDGGSSVGVVVIQERSQLVPTLAVALAGDEPLLVEEFVRGTELTCGVLEERSTHRPLPLPVTEIVPRSGGGFFDYQAKYTRGGSEEITPARITEAARDRVQALALLAHEALGCSAYSRSDFILRSNGSPVILETNTLPGLTATSLLPQAAAAIGLDYPALLTRILDLAIGR